MFFSKKFINSIGMRVDVLESSSLQGLNRKYVNLYANRFQRITYGFMVGESGLDSDEVDCWLGAVPIVRKQKHFGFHLNDFRF
jgi:hypothetical protein